MGLTVSDLERHAYLSGDVRTLYLLDQIELEADDPQTESDALKVHEDGWESNAWCIGCVADALQAASPLSQSAMHLLAAELLGLVDRLPRKGQEEVEFKARVNRICGQDEHPRHAPTNVRPRVTVPRSRPRPTVRVASERST